MNSDEASKEANQFYNEVHNLVKRWTDEGDELTSFGLIGALEAAKADILDSLVKYNRSKEEG